jgi:poly(A) polymerase
MVEPLVVARSQHTLSRRDIDPDALRVLYRLHHANFLAYLVGGSVRDLLLGRRPKDFDIGTSAHPYQVKRLFRNCWIIGRRFRLAHVKFGQKTIEVATFRRNVPAGSEGEPPVPAEPPPQPSAGEPALAEQLSDGITLLTDDAMAPPAGRREHTGPQDNTFGTPEEDAFRRDFTVNALFYDVGAFSIIDYTGGLEDLEKRLIRCIGDPDERFVEDPVRMLRAIVLAARLDFTVDPPIYDAIRRNAAEIEKSSPARLMEEYFKILRSGASLEAFRALGATGLLRHISPEVPAALPHALQDSLEALDAYRRRFESIPETMTTPVLLGSLIVPLGLARPRPRRRADDEEEPALRTLPRLGQLPVARKDVERLAHLLSLQPRLLETSAPLRRQHGVVRRPAFADALTWMEIHGQSPDVVAYWRALAEELGPVPKRRPLGPGEARPGAPAEPIRIGDEAPGAAHGTPTRRRRRRRRRGPRTE